MRAATRKPRWYISRGLPVPMPVVMFRMDMVRRKEARLATREDDSVGHFIPHVGSNRHQRRARR